jgi:hypothetical protein
MARTRTLTNLTSDVRVRADMVGSSFPQDPEIQEWLNQGWAELYDLLIASGEKYYLTTALGNTSNGVEEYAVPADHYKTLGISVQVSGGRPRPAHRFQFERRDDYDPNGWNWPNRVYYDLWGGNIHFMPVPSGVYPYKHYYYPAPVRLVNGTDFWDGVAGWEQYAIDWAAKKVAARDDNYELVAVIAGDMTEMKARVKTMADNRIPGEAKRVRVVRGRIDPLRILQVPRWRA